VTFVFRWRPSRLGLLLSRSVKLISLVCRFGLSAIRSLEILRTSFACEHFSPLAENRWLASPRLWNRRRQKYEQTFSRKMSQHFFSILRFQTLTRHVYLKTSCIHTYVRTRSSKAVTTYVFILALPIVNSVTKLSKKCHF
jgi:hypothetical protein